ncbi:MAG: biotin--[acetyl-CoA-carboxylase] ligase [Candidatus Rokuibacteriota bacterium]
MHLAAVESTQAVAFTLAAEGAADGTVVVADHQSAGRGRRGHVWTDAPGTSLLASILVRPRAPLALWPAFSPTTAVAVAEALRQTSGLETRLKWPNDVLAGGRKIAGILLESRGGTADPVLIIGVGINLAQREFAPELADRATSVALETGRAPERDALLDVLLEEFDAWRARLEAEGFEPVRSRWLALGETIGRRVTIDGVTGVAVGLDADGALLLEEHGRVRRVVAGEVAGATPAPEGRADRAARR